MRPVDDHWDEDLALPAPPPGVRVARERTFVRIVAPLPRRRAVAGMLAVVALLALGAVAAALQVHPASTAMAAAWWLVIGCSGLAAAVAAPLAALALRARRVVVMTPGVLLVSEGAGPFAHHVSCLRGSVRAVEAVPDADGHLGLRVESELSPTAQRVLGLEVAEDEELLVALPVCRHEEPEVARFYGRVIAGWAHAPLVEGEPPPAARN